jgi:hypothetical protein
MRKWQVNGACLQQQAIGRAVSSLPRIFHGEVNHQIARLSRSVPMAYLKVF